MPPVLQPSVSSATNALPLWIICGALTVVVIALIAAWLIHSIARDALSRADPKDIPEVVRALSVMAQRFNSLAPRRDYLLRQRRSAEDVRLEQGTPGEGSE